MILLSIVLHILSALGLCLGRVSVQDLPVVSPRLGLNIAGYSQLVGLHWRVFLVETGGRVSKVAVGVLGPLSVGVTQGQAGLLEE